MNQFVEKKCLNELALQKLLTLEGLNWGNLSKEDIQTSILLQKESEFFILYQMICDDLPEQISQQKKNLNNLMFKEFWSKVQLALEEENYFQREIIEQRNAKELQIISRNSAVKQVQWEWQYGIAITLKIEILLEAITNTLVKQNLVCTFNQKKFS
eukprot:TRINITY_DN14087_c0_g1_i5.p4 TRINITY_DN14087_c0_g1~~TRINITY_DN14087_c0_g1_i5.p4  ORF type:complete len:156 (-),score=27.54 TRINITY_DN14087_c0_g1_i5:663-1130(-)